MIVSLVGGVILGVSAASAVEGPYSEGAAIGLLAGGLTLSVGAPLLVTGLVAPPRRTLVRNDVSMRFAPSVAKDSVVGSLALTF